MKRSGKEDNIPKRNQTAKSKKYNSGRLDIIPLSSIRNSEGRQYRLRLQVFLSHSGMSSRRGAMALIQEGSVTVNGQKVQEPSFKVDPQKDKVCVKGQFVQQKFFEYILLNKPRGYVTTKSDRFADKMVYDLLLPEHRNLPAVGRLDKDTEGLLLFTNDGDLAYRLTHPKFNVLKTYFVIVQGRLDPEVISKIERGMLLDGKKTAPAKIKHVQYQARQTQLYLTIHEGRKRQIRLMFAQLLHKVDYLKRLTQGPLSLGTLKTGCWRQLNQKEMETLKKV